MTRRPLTSLLTILLAATLTAGCRRGAEAPAGEGPAEDAGPPLVSQAVDDLPEVSYDPPSDGRLTDEQVEMYLEVERAAGERDGDPFAAGLRAAHELGHNYKEYAWVAARIADAQIARSSLRLEEELAESRTEYLEVLRARLGAASSKTERSEVERRIAELEEGETSPPEVSDAERHNAELVAKYEERLVEVQSAEERFAAGGGPEEALEPPAELSEPAEPTEVAEPEGGQEPEG